MQAISTSNLYSSTIGDALNVQTQWSTAETQQASGLQAQDFGTLGGWLRQSGLRSAALLEGGYSPDLPVLVEAFLRGWNG